MQLAFPSTHTGSRGKRLRRLKFPWVTPRVDEAVGSGELSGPFPCTITFSLFTEKLEHSLFSGFYAYFPQLARLGSLSLVLSPCVHAFLLPALTLSWGSETAADESCRVFFL